MRSDYRLPLNLGRDEMISINQLVDLVARIAGKQIGKIHDLSQPVGVRGRNSDNSRCRAILDWEPQITLEEGLRRTYAWIAQELGVCYTEGLIPVETPSALKGFELRS